MHFLIHARGEKLAAMRCVQVHALDRVLEFLEQRQAEISDASVTRDPYNVDLRIEARHAQLIQSLPLWAGGYEHTVSAALALLNVLESHAVVPGKAAEHIVALTQLSAQSTPNKA
jgi:hypothetical protein